MWMYYPKKEHEIQDYLGRLTEISGLLFVILEQWNGWMKSNEIVDDTDHEEVQVIARILLPDRRNVEITSDDWALPIIQSKNNAQMNLKENHFKSYILYIISIEIWWGCSCSNCNIQFELLHTETKQKYTHLILSTFNLFNNLQAWNYV